MNRWVAIVVFLFVLLSSASVAQEIRRPPAETTTSVPCGGTWQSGTMPNFWDGSGSATSSVSSVSSISITTYCHGSDLSGFGAPSMPYSSLQLKVDSACSGNVNGSGCSILLSTNGGLSFVYIDDGTSWTQHTVTVTLGPAQNLSLLRVRWQAHAQGYTTVNELGRVIWHQTTASISGYDVRTEGIIVPSAPTSLVAAPTSGGFSVNLAWTDNATTETSYKVQRCTGTTCTPADLITGLAASSSSYSDPTTSPGMTYQYNVCAVNAAGFTCAAAPVTVTTSFPDVPVPPDGCNVSSLQRPSDLVEL
jgi:hypothetical protein